MNNEHELLAGVPESTAKEIMDEVVRQVKAEAAAKKAIDYVLCRIRDDQDIRYRMGAATETFHLLTKAYALLTGKKQAEVCEDFLEGSGDLCMEDEE